MQTGFRKVMIDDKVFRCDACESKICQNCDDDVGKCSQCFNYLSDFPSFVISQQCLAYTGCIEYQKDSPNLKCLQTNINFFIQRDSDFTSAYGWQNCYYCGQTNCRVCQPGYYFATTCYAPNYCLDECLKQNSCNSFCNTCYANDSNFCTSCFNDEKLTNGQCSCPADLQLFNNDGICLHCKKGICQTCLTFYDCLSCKPETFRELVGTKCYCQNGYYDNGDELFVCQKCHPTCFACFGGEISNCIACNNQQHRHLLKGECICDSGFGEIDLTHNNKECQKCHLRCRLCVLANDPNSCTACWTQQNRQLSINSNCQCKQTYGDNLGVLDICYICHFTCGYCVGGLKTDCVSCPESSYRHLINNQCVCQKGYFESAYQQTECLNCHYSCSDCLANSETDQCTECNSERVPNGSGTTFSCVCQNSNYFDDVLGKKCTQCHYSCLTCTYFGPSFCSSCVTTIRKYSFQKCLCFDRTYDDGISSCKPCHPNCLTCFGNKITECLTCSADIDYRFLKQESCLCVEGYFEENYQKVCQKCSYRCRTCQVSKDQCIVCVANSYRELGSDLSCACPSGFYDLEGILVFCHLKCQRCFGVEENQCSDCKPLSNRSFSNNQCLCLPHYFEANVEQCSICSSTCYECEINFNNCTSCPKERYLVGNTCICGTKLQGQLLSTYEVIGTNQCSLCHYSCLTCNGSTFQKCTSCYDLENRYTTGTQCLCNAGYFDSGLPSCQKCSYQCLTCIYSENRCLACQQNSLRILNTQSKICACNTGYFDDGQNPICQKCDYTCFQCSMEFKHCLECELKSNRQFNETLFSCDCVPGYYDNGESTCIPCHYSCYECLGQGSQQCKSCKTFNPFSKRELLNSKCVCSIGYYDDGYSNNCQPCDAQCENCEENSYNCTACSTTRQYSNSTCECLVGYFDIGQKECKVCDLNCLKCRITSKNCVSCDSTKFKILDQETKTCICQSNYLEVNGVCEKCYQCLTCLNSIDNCILCEPDRYLSNNQCLCQEGLYDFQGICLYCHKSCLTCQDTERFCTTCSSLNHRKLTINNTCDCIASYFDYLMTNSCEKCHYSCKTCNLTSQNCTSCDQTLNLDLIDNKCVCKIGFYFDITQQCQQCHISCQSCIEFGKCTSCLEETRSFDASLEVCDCKQGYFEANQSDCQKCNDQCYTCENTQKNCLSCHPLANRQLYGNACICQDGFFDAGIDICMLCGIKCKTCINNTNNCTLCYEIEQRRQLFGNICVCQSGYFENGSDICEKCSLKCKTCLNSAEYCTSCDIDQKRLDHSVNHKCPCMQGFYDNQGICEKCHIKCESCLNTRENCLTCNSPLKSNRYLLSDQCNCKTGYYDDNVQLDCQKCSQRCKTCVENEFNCLACKSNQRINPPICKCLDGYYEDQSQYCMKCSNQCLTCETTEINCLSCKIGRINKSCDCQTGYFEAGQENCLQCGFQCQECSQSTQNCTICKGNRINLPSCQCADGYYDDGVTVGCVACDYRCLKCNHEGCLICNGNRILTNEKHCNPPENSISYTTTPWCSNCQVAVLIIRFSDDLNSILIQFDFELKQTQQSKRCSEILHNDTITKLGIGYKCEIDQSNFSILKISLGQEPSILVGDQTQLIPDQLSHINCLQKLKTFIFNTVNGPSNFLEPIIQFEIPINKLSSCIENTIFSNFTNNHGKRMFMFINWSYKIVDQKNSTALDEFIEFLNANKLIDLIIPALTLPQNSEITFLIQVHNFLGIQSTTSFNISTQQDSQPTIQVFMKSQYYVYQNINIKFSINVLNCYGESQVQNPLFLVYLQETNRSIETATSSNINFSKQSSDTSYSVLIPKYTLTPLTNYYFNLIATEINSQKSSSLYFNFEIMLSEVFCQFENTNTIQDSRQDFNLYIQCKDMNTNLDWNTDQDLLIEIKCLDLFTSQVCKNQQNQEINIKPNGLHQKVPKYSVKPYTVQSWQVVATKANLKKGFEKLVVFLEEGFLPLSIKYDIAYSIRPINNYELLNFTFQVPIKDKQNFVGMSVEIICDFVVLQLIQPKAWIKDSRKQ